MIATQLPTRWGPFRALGYARNASDGSDRVETAIALLRGDLTQDAPLVRIHSECLTGELFRSLRCDCAEQLDIAMRAIEAENRGLVIYEHQEGRGIGLMAKLRAYSLQDLGYDTVEANQALGFEVDQRDFALPAAILHELGIGRVRLLSNNPRKSRALSDAGIEIIERVPCQVAPTAHSWPYLRTKRDKMGHALVLDSSSRFCACAAPLKSLEAEDAARSRSIE